MHPGALSVLARCVLERIPGYHRLFSTSPAAGKRWSHRQREERDDV